MSTSMLLAKSEYPRDRSVARIIPIQFILEKKVKERIKTSSQDETILFYSKPIFRAKKYEFF
jgi:hypothetical protein